MSNGGPDFQRIEGTVTHGGRKIKTYSKTYVPNDESIVNMKSLELYCKFHQCPFKK